MPSIPDRPNTLAPDRLTLPIPAEAIIAAGVAEPDGPGRLRYTPIQDAKPLPLTYGGHLIGMYDVVTVTGIGRYGQPIEYVAELRRLP